MKKLILGLVLGILVSSGVAYAAPKKLPSFPAWMESGRAFDPTYGVVCYSRFTGSNGVGISCVKVN